MHTKILTVALVGIAAFLLVHDDRPAGERAKVGDEIVSQNLWTIFPENSPLLQGLPQEIVRSYGVWKVLAENGQNLECELVGYVDPATNEFHHVLKLVPLRAPINRLVVRKIR